MKNRDSALLIAGNILYVIGSLFSMAQKPEGYFIKSVGLVLLVLMILDMAILYFKKRKNNPATK